MQWRIVGLKLIAEGVEDEDQLYMLKQLKCDCVQGFLLVGP
ncbi:MAG: EAL domain-containing protein [Gammaproteobacteria bacterium]|nr:EAL domain-containing protein [Gammaproteobacteria bacterium]